MRSSQARFSQQFLIEPDTYVRGILQPVEENSLPTYDFAEGRLALRTAPGEPVKIGDVMVDAYGRRFLLGHHGVNVYRCFQMTDLVTWSRVMPTTDPVTGLKKESDRFDLPPIWCAIELYGRVPIDATLKVEADIRRVITGAPVQLGDKIDGALVKRKVKIFGVNLLEIQ
jgi:hypothetical protein